MLSMNLDLIHVMAYYWLSTTVGKWGDTMGSLLITPRWVVILAISIHCNVLCQFRMLAILILKMDKEKGIGKGKEKVKVKGNMISFFIFLGDY